MSNKKDIAPHAEHCLYDGWKAAKPDFTFYSTTCNSTPHGTPSPFALKIEEKRKQQSAVPAQNI